LREEDIHKVEAVLSDEHRAVWDAADTLQRHRLTLAYGLSYGVEGVAARTGLTASAPPDDVHLMFRGIEETGGAYYYADLVLEWIARAGQTLQPEGHVLDFSCSSGRVVRVLQAALPGVRWHGCDPNAGAIAWARENISNVDFFQADLSPPLKFERASLDAAFAISVWSHYSPTAAIRWLEEMHRVVRPGGHLILTTHGLQSCVWLGEPPDRGLEAQLGEDWIVQTAARLQSDGHCFWDVFGSRGDMGVVADDWGLAFFTPEWLLANVTPDWSVSIYRIGRAAGNQDVFALRRT
jgi:SAM-dependent methyltransferase